jgi:hypothetical protein
MKDRQGLAQFEGRSIGHEARACPGKRVGGVASGARR